MIERWLFERQIQELSISLSDRQLYDLYNHMQVIIDEEVAEGLNEEQVNVIAVLEDEVSALECEVNDLQDEISDLQDTIIARDEEIEKLQQLVRFLKA